MHNIALAQFRTDITTLLRCTLVRINLAEPLFVTPHAPAGSPLLRQFSERVERRFQRISSRSFAVGDNQQIVNPSITEYLKKNVRCRFKTISRYESGNIRLEN